jgi:hypothetical protein
MRDYAKENDAALAEYAAAKDAYFNLSGNVTRGFAAVYKGDHQANPPLDLLDATERARLRWKAAKKRVLEIGVEWASAAQGRQQSNSGEGDHEQSHRVSVH